MRKVKYTSLPPVSDFEEHKHGSVKDLLFGAPYLFAKYKRNVIPPLYILNDYLKKGIDDGGMSGGLRWKPFELTEKEYDELMKKLLTEPSYNFCVVKTPINIKTYERWRTWKIRFEKI